MVLSHRHCACLLLLPAPSIATHIRSQFRRWGRGSFPAWSASISLLQPRPLWLTTGTPGVPRSPYREGRPPDPSLSPLRPPSSSPRHEAGKHIPTGRNSDRFTQDATSFLWETQDSQFDFLPLENVLLKEPGSVLTKVPSLCSEARDTVGLTGRQQPDGQSREPRKTPHRGGNMCAAERSGSRKEAHLSPHTAPGQAGAHARGQKPTHTSPEPHASHRIDRRWVPR